MTTTTGRAPVALSTTSADSTVARVAGALLALGVSWFHVVDQGGLTALKDPAYVGQGYRLLELAGVVVALLLLLRRPRAAPAGWLLAAGVALGPIVGFVLSRGPGLPGYTDDKGIWTEPLALQAHRRRGAAAGARRPRLSGLRRRGTSS